MRYGQRNKWKYDRFPEDSPPITISKDGHSKHMSVHEKQLQGQPGRDYESKKLSLRLGKLFKSAS